MKGETERCVETDANSCRKYRQTIGNLLLKATSNILWSFLMCYQWLNTCILDESDVAWYCLLCSSKTSEVESHLTDWVSFK